MNQILLDIDASSRRQGTSKFRAAPAASVRIQSGWINEVWLA
jgi:hypothetical protein